MGEGSDEIGDAGPVRLEVLGEVRRRGVALARAFRKEPTKSEGVLWRALRGRRLAGRKFRRQQPIGPFVVDFFCAEEHLVVEVDGPIHANQLEADKERQLLLEASGLRVLRLNASEVEQDLEGTLHKISASFSQAP